MIVWPRQHACPNVGASVEGATVGDVGPSPGVVGDIVGANVGLAVDPTVGIADGATVGTLVGATAGAAVGIAVGAVVGIAVGIAVCIVVGVNVGAGGVNEFFRVDWKRLPRG